MNNGEGGNNNKENSRAMKQRRSRNRGEQGTNTPASEHSTAGAAVANGDGELPRGERSSSRLSGRGSSNEGSIPKSTGKVISETPSTSALTLDLHEFHSTEKSTEKIRVSWLLQLLLILNLLFCTVEIAVGITSSSMVMLTDGFHNLSDVLMLMLTLVVHLNQDREHPLLPFGYKRLEVIGGLVTTVLMVALAFFVMLGAIPEIAFGPEPMYIGPAFLAVAGTSLFLNMIGVIGFAQYGLHHHHGGINSGHSCAGHSHGSHGHGHGGEKAAVAEEAKEEAAGETDRLLAAAEEGHDHSHGHSHGHGHGHGGEGCRAHAGSDHGGNEQDDKLSSRENSLNEPRIRYSTNVNLWAVFLHSVADSLFSIVVIGVGLLIYLCDHPLAEYADPLASLIMGGVILFLGYPLLRDACLILMEGCPPTVDKDVLRALVQEVDGVLDAPKVAVVQLNVDASFANIGVVVDGKRPSFKIIRSIKRRCRKLGIAEVTVEVDDSLRYV